MTPSILAFATAFAVQPAVVRPGDTVKVVYENPAFVGHRVTAHFGFNGWNLPLSGQGSGASIRLDNVDYYKRLPLVPDGDRFVLELEIPEGARAFHAAFCKDECDTGDWDNHDGRDYGWPVVFPFIGPVLTWNEHTPPESGVVVSFETGAPMPGYVEYGEPGAAPRRVVSPSGETHRIALTGLRPDTRYEYRVGAGALVSSTFAFKTAQAPDALTSMRFVVFGDAQDDGEHGRFAELADELVRTQGDADFVLSTGDLPANDRPGDWWTFFDKGRAFFSTKVFMPALGNHDTPTVNSNSDHRSFVRYFALPEITLEHPFYRFRYGTAEFFGMNSERPGEMQPGGVQYEFLREQLERPASWRFAYWHIPPFNAGARHFQQQGDVRQLAGLFDGKLDWHFGGHEHIYQRMKPLQDAGGTPRIVERYGTRPDEGVGYVMMPAGGVDPGTRFVKRSDYPRYRDRLAFPRLADDEDTVPRWIGFLRVELLPHAFRMETWQVPAGGGAGRIVDRVEYVK
jgi:hypothetical protein